MMTSSVSSQQRLAFWCCAKEQLQCNCLLRACETSFLASQGTRAMSHLAAPRCFLFHLKALSEYETSQRYNVSDSVCGSHIVIFGVSCRAVKAATHRHHLPAHQLRPPPWVHALRTISIGKSLAKSS
jgi:hypothetical protein